MRLRNLLKICLVFWKSEPQYAYKHYAYKKTCDQTRKRERQISEMNMTLGKYGLSRDETYNIKGQFYEQFLK